MVALEHRGGCGHKAGPGSVVDVNESFIGLSVLLVVPRNAHLAVTVAIEVTGAGHPETVVGVVAAVAELLHS